MNKGKSIKIIASVLIIVLIIGAVIFAISNKTENKEDEKASTTSSTNELNPDYHEPGPLKEYKDSIRDKDIKVGTPGDVNACFSYNKNEKSITIDARNRFLPEFACHSDGLLEYSSDGRDCGLAWDDGDELLTPQEIREIKSAYLKNGVTMIYSDPFEYFEGLEEITLPKSLKRILRNTFSASKGLKTVYFEGTQKEWESIKIDDGNDYLNNAKIVFNVDVEKTASPEQKDEATSVKEITDNATATLDYYTGVVTINGTGSIGMNQETGFNVAKNIDDLFVDDWESIALLPQYVDEIVVEEGITELGAGIFSTTSAKAITLPKSLTAINEGAFSQISNKITIKYNGSKEDFDKINISSENNDALNDAKMVYLLD